VTGAMTGSMTGPTTGPVTGDAVTLYGDFSLGAAEVALPLSELREVIPRPATFESLPMNAPGLVGAVNLRHLVIPVLDLCNLDGRGRGEGDVIVIVAHDGYVFGLLAGEIRGVVRVADSALLETTVSDRHQLFSHSFERPDNGATVSVLDCAAIVALPGAPRVRDSTPAGVNAVAEAGAEIAGRQRMVMLLRSADIGLCIDVKYVHSVVPQLVIKESTLAGGQCRGVVELDGTFVPAIDPLDLIGLGRLPADAAHRGIALKLPRGLVVLTVSEVASIEAVPDAAFVTLPPFGMPRPDLLHGIVDLPGPGQHLVLNGSALRELPELDVLAGLGMPIHAGATAVKSTVDARRSADEAEGREIFDSVRPFLTYSVGRDVATPLMQISEIVPYPERLIPLERGGAVRGVFVHRKTSVPLICLGTLLGEYDVDMTRPSVLLVDVDRGLVGFIVPALRAIEASVWEEKPLDRAKAPEELLRSGPLVKVGLGDQARMIPHIDLQELASVG
jgi:purine-binding chemotaxis protein CheW